MSCHSCKKPPKCCKCIICPPPPPPPNPVVFRGSGTNLQVSPGVIGPGFITKITFPIENIDTANAYDPLNSRFVAPSDGIYEFNTAFDCRRAVITGQLPIIASFLFGNETGASYGPTLNYSSLAIGEVVIPIAFSTKIQLLQGQIVEVYIINFSSTILEITNPPTGNSIRTFTGSKIA